MLGYGNYGSKMTLHDALLPNIMHASQHEQLGTFEGLSVLGAVKWDSRTVSHTVIHTVASLIALYHAT
jgi:hypothetical protein